MNSIERDADAAPESREALIGRKQDIFAALRALERDYADGVVDAGAYKQARLRYELEAANILERLDQVGSLSASVPTPATGRRLAPIAFGAVALGVVAIGVFLFSALRERSANDPVTGNPPLAAPTPIPAQLIAAERAIQKHPASSDAFVALGNAYLTANNPAAADVAFRHAIRLDPRNPEPATMHALVLGSTQNHISEALALLRAVERSNPTFTHAWLVDGLLSARRPPGYPRAIAAYKRFLALAPHSSVAPYVRSLLAGLERSLKSTN